MSTSPPNEPSSPRPGRRSSRWRMAVLPLAVVAPLTLAACGGSDDDTAASGSGSAAGSEQAGQFQGPNSEELQKYTSCLEENGVTLPERGDGQGGPPQGEDGARPTPPTDENGEMVPPTGADGEAPQPPADGEMPQGAPGQGGPGGGGMFGLDTSDATVQAAMQACADLQPQMPQGGPGQAPA